jgi:hypothetical protein
MLEKLSDEQFRKVMVCLDRFDDSERDRAFLNLCELRIVGYDEDGAPTFERVLHVPDIELSSNP